MRPRRPLPLPHCGRGRGPLRQQWEGEGGAASSGPAVTARLRLAYPHPARCARPSPAMRERGNEATLERLFRLGSSVEGLHADVAVADELPSVIAAAMDLEGDGAAA